MRRRRRSADCIAIWPSSTFRDAGRSRGSDRRASIGATIAINVAAGVWQEHQASTAVEALRRLGTATARVLRDGTPTTLPATELVPGDVLLLAPGPINRGVEVTPEVADGPHSAILRQVTNGLAVRMAVLAQVCGRA